MIFENGCMLELYVASNAMRLFSD